MGGPLGRSPRHRGLCSVARLRAWALNAITSPNLSCAICTMGVTAGPLARLMGGDWYGQEARNSASGTSRCCRRGERPGVDLGSCPACLPAPPAPPTPYSSGRGRTAPTRHLLVGTLRCRHHTPPALVRPCLCPEHASPSVPHPCRSCSGCRAGSPRKPGHFCLARATGSWPALASLGAPGRGLSGESSPWATGPWGAFHDF